VHGAWLLLCTASLTAVPKMPLQRANYSSYNSCFMHNYEGMVRLVQRVF
jgi:hypothetical protein